MLKEGILSVEVCLAVIAITLIVLAIVLTKISLQSKQAIRLIQNDIHNVSKEITHVLNTVNDFVRADLHAVSQETSHLINNLNGLSSDVNRKINSLNFLFRPLSFLNSKLDSDAASNESVSKLETIPQILKWIASSVFLIKTTKEIMKK